MTSRSLTGSSVGGSASNGSTTTASRAVGISSSLALALALGSASCGGGETRTRSPESAALVVAPVAVSKTSAPNTTTTAPLARAEFPPGTTVVIRAADPEALLQEVMAIVPRGLGAILQGSSPEQLLHMAFGKKLGSLVDLSQSVDAVLDGTSRFVVSFVLKPDAEARLARDFTLREQNGLVYVDLSNESLNGARACAFGRTGAHASPRLLCSEDADTLERQGAYLLRVDADERLVSDIRVSVPGALFSERGRHDGVPRRYTDGNDDNDARRAGRKVAEDFFKDIARVDTDLRIGRPTLEVDVDVQFGGHESIVTRALLSSVPKAPPPPAFWRLPRDSAFAVHATGARAEDLAPLRDAVLEQFDSGFADAGTPSEVIANVNAALKTVVGTGGPIVFAGGIVGGQAGAVNALSAIESAKDKARAEATARSALVPWLIGEFDEPAERWTKAVRAVFDADKAATNGKPRKDGKAADPKDERVSPHLVAVDPKLGLPKESLHIDVAFIPNTKGARATRHGHLFIVPASDGANARTWFGYSEDMNAVATRLRTAIGTVEADTLATATDVQSLRTVNTNTVGFASIVGTALFLGERKTSEDLQKQRKKVASLGQGSPTGAVLWHVETAAADESRLHLHGELAFDTVKELVRSVVP